jgi:hypothetical protein
MCNDLILALHNTFVTNGCVLVEEYFVQEKHELLVSVQGGDLVTSYNYYLFYSTFKHRAFLFFLSGKFMFTAMPHWYMS